MRDPSRHVRQALRRRAAGLILLALAAGCTSPSAEEAPLEAASIEGSIVVGDAFRLVDARLTVAPAAAGPEGTRARPVPLADPPWTARTPLQRDHWVLEAHLEERAPGRGSGLHSVRLDWNGEPAGELHVEGGRANKTLGVLVRYDVGPALARSNVYSFELRKTP